MVTYDVRLVNNCFWNNMGGVYQFWDPQSNLTLIEDDVSKFIKKNKKKLSISKQSKGNVALDPKLGKIDKDFFNKFSNQIKSTGGGKVKWDSVNNLRSTLGLPLIGSKGSGRSNFAPIYERDFAILLPTEAKAKSYGVQIKGPFLAYKSKVAGAGKKYATAEFAALIKDAALDGKNVEFTKGISKKKSNSDFYRKDKADTKKYYCFELGQYPKNTYIYVQKGSKALEAVLEGMKTKTDVILQGTCWDIKSTKKKVVVVIDTAELDEED